MIYCFGHFVYIFETLQMANVCAQRMNTQNVYLVCVCACLFVFFLILLNTFYLCPTEKLFTLLTNTRQTIHFIFLREL